MAVTNQNIKDSISPEAGDVFGIGPKTVGNTELNRLKAWFEAEYSEQLDGREATANDFAAFLWQQCAAKVKNHERGIAEAAVLQPTEFSER